MVFRQAKCGRRRCGLAGSLLYKTLTIDVDVDYSIIFDHISCCVMLEKKKDDARSISARSLK